jgi:hypothetical protein
MSRGGANPSGIDAIDGSARGGGIGRLAVVIGVGGFLGMGEREVAVEFNKLRLWLDGSEPVATIEIIKDALKNAPEWNWAGDQSGSITGKGTPPVK